MRGIHSSVSDMSLVQTFELTCVIVIMIPYHKFPSTGTKIQDSSTAQKKCGSWISTLDFCEPPPEEKRTGELVEEASKSQVGSIM